MIECAITAIGDISFSLNGQYSVLLPYFIFGGIVMVVIGYWIKNDGRFHCVIERLIGLSLFCWFF
jgi:hypothetical protein